MYYKYNYNKEYLDRIMIIHLVFLFRYCIHYMKYFRFYYKYNYKKEYLDKIMIIHLVYYLDIVFIILCILDVLQI